jgi:hypothetical protein
MENYQEENQWDFIGNELNSPNEQWGTVKDELDSENEKSSLKKEKKPLKKKSESEEWIISPELVEEFSGRED